MSGYPLKIIKSLHRSTCVYYFLLKPLFGGRGLLNYHELSYLSIEPSICKAKVLFSSPHKTVSIGKSITFLLAMFFLGEEDEGGVGVERKSRFHLGYFLPQAKQRC